MNLETRLEKRLWGAVRVNLENQNFTGAILDGMHFLSELLREKSGVEADGVSLVGQALGGDSPKLKVNLLQSESDWNVQKGLEQLLRGMYTAIRNPRSHEKYHDSEVDADAILLFIDYVVRVVDKAKSPFVLDEFVERVFDPSYVVSAQYSKLLLAEVPQKQKLSLFFEIFRARDRATTEVLESLLVPLINSLNDEERRSVFTTVSDELKVVSDDREVARLIRIFASYWPHFAEVGRLRIENMLLHWIRGGRFADGRYLAGGLGIWAERIFEHLTLKREYFSAMKVKLDSENHQSQDYVLQSFSSDLGKLSPSPDPSINRIFANALEADDRRFFNALRWRPPWPLEAWGEDVVELFEQIKKRSPDDFEDDIPF